MFSPRTPLGELSVPSKPLAGWKGPKTPTPAHGYRSRFSALLISCCDPSGPGLSGLALTPTVYSNATGTGLEVCMGVENPTGIPFPWESHGNGNSHTVHDGNGNGNGNKANGNGNSIYFTRVKIPKIIVMH